MSDLQFNTGTDDFARPAAPASSFDLAGKLVEWGFVSSRQEASYVLIAVVVLILLGSIFFFRSNVASYPTLDTSQTIIYN